MMKNKVLLSKNSKVYSLLVLCSIFVFLGCVTTSEIMYRLEGEVPDSVVTTMRTGAFHTCVTATPVIVPTEPTRTPLPTYTPPAPVVTGGSLLNVVEINGNPQSYLNWGSLQLLDRLDFIPDPSATNLPASWNISAYDGISWGSIASGAWSGNGGQTVDLTGYNAQQIVFNVVTWQNANPPDGNPNGNLFIYDQISVAPSGPTPTMLPTETPTVTPTPVPTETPYYEEGLYYMNQPFFVGSGLRFMFSDFTRVGNNVIVKVTVANNERDQYIVPITNLVFVRKAGIQRGLWYNQNWLLRNNSYPDIPRSDYEPMALGETREYWLAFDTPSPAVNEFGLKLAWDVDNGGTAIWIQNQNSPDPCVHGEVAIGDSAAPPTPNSVVESGASGTKPEGGGVAIMPINTGRTRGFECSKFFTGIKPAPGQCPPDEPATATTDAIVWWFHNAIDLVAPEGSVMVAPISGEVIFAGTFASTCCDCSNWDALYGYANKAPYYGFGYYLRIEGQGQVHLLAHLQGTLYRPDGTTLNITDAAAQTDVVGQVYQQGDSLAQLGHTGCSSTPHTHWQCFIGGVAINPDDC